MSAYLKLTITVFAALFISCSSLKNQSKTKTLFSRLYVNKSINNPHKEVFIVFDNGLYNYYEDNNSIPYEGKLLESQFKKFKKLTANSTIINFLKEEYDCSDVSLEFGDVLYSFRASLPQKKVTIHGNCKIPKRLNELNNLIAEVLANK